MTALSPNFDIPFGFDPLDLALGLDLDFILGLGLVNSVILQEALSSHWTVVTSRL